MPYLNENMVNAYYKFQLFNNPLGQVPSTRIEFCIDFIQSAMPYALGRVFAESLLLKGSKVIVIKRITGSEYTTSLYTIENYILYFRKLLHK